ncbi:MAG: molybdenum cofactor biosynthesis protein MoaE [Vulcanimicrobiaceae bacterium]
MYELTSEPIELAPLIAAVRTDACGAIVAFLGVVRADSDDEKPVDGLSYEAYPAMAVPEIRAIVDEAKAHFGPCEVAVVHRVGDLKLGEPSVAIVVAAPHRGPAFDACERIIDELKKRVPIWKKEHYINGEASWRTNSAQA